MALNPAEALKVLIDDRVEKVRLTGIRTLANLVKNGSVVTTRNPDIRWTVNLGGAAATGALLIANTTTSDDSNAETANLSIGDYRFYHNFAISRFEIQQSATLAPEDLANIFQARVDEGINAILRALNSAIWLGVGGSTWAGITGLREIADAGTSYANITTTGGNAEWNPIELTSGTARALTRRLLLDADELVGIRESGYDTVIMHPTTAKIYQDIFDTIAGDRSVVDMSELQGLKRADLGHGGRYYNGFPVIEDNQCPPGEIYMMDSAYVKLYFMRFDNTSKPAGSSISDIRVSDVSGIPIHIAELPSSNSTTHIFEMYIVPQLVVRNRKHLIKIDNLLTTYS